VRGPVARSALHAVRQTTRVVIPRCAPPFAASLEGWTRVQASAAILRDAAQGRGSSRDNGEAVTRG
jgi:hypothetical protein